MRLNFFMCALGAFTLTVPTLALPNPSTPRAVDNSSSTLKPIKTRDFERATGVYRRSGDKFSELDPQTQSQLIYGRPGTQNQFVLANMTLYAADGLQIVTLERFESLTSGVDCNDDDGIMSLTFKSKSAFKYALKTWAFLNDLPENKFLLIANHAQCGPEDERQPYIVSNIREDHSKLTTFLTAEPAKWSEVAHTYDLEFGKVSAPKDLRRKRGVSDAISGNYDKEGSASFSVAAGQPNRLTNIVSTSALNIDCVNCFTTGSFQVTGRIVTRHFKVMALTMNASPQGVAATLLLNTTITAENADTFEHTKQLFSEPIPDAGIDIPGIISIGAILQFDVGVTVTFTGSATFQAGLSASLPDSAKVVADVKSPGNSQATGFDTASLEPIFNVHALAASIDVTAFARPQLVFGIDLHHLGHAEATVSVQLPSISAKLEAKFNEAGACPGDPDKSQTGAELSSDVGVEVEVGSSATFGSLELPSLSNTLLDISKPLFSKCYPIDTPAHSPNNSSTIPPLEVTTITVDPSKTKLEIVPITDTAIVDPRKTTLAIVPIVYVTRKPSPATLPCVGIASGSVLPCSASSQASFPIPGYGNGTATLLSRRPVITGVYTAA